MSCIYSLFRSLSNRKWEQVRTVSLVGQERGPIADSPYSQKKNNSLELFKKHVS